MDSKKRLIDRKSMEKQGAKKRRRQEEGSMDMDRISQLPPPTVHHILSFLSQKEAVQTCLLSKSWRYLWNARPNFEFREKWFKGNKKNLLSVLGNTLQRYHDQNLSIQQLYLEMMMTWDDDPKLVSLFGKWIPIVMLNMGLKTFKLCSYSLIYFDMPSAVFQAKSLQELDLTNCKLNFDKNSTDNLFLLRNLRKLNLIYAHISEETLEHMLSSCPLIDFLDLNQCELLRTINLNKARNLKHFGFQGFYKSSTVIHIPTSTLESIHSEGSPNWFSHPENIYFPNLKSLHLICVELSAQSFDKFSSKYCPCLENLKLHNCKDFKVFQLSSRSITRLEILIDGEIKGFKADIDAPNLLYFVFSSSFVPSISFSTTCGEWESHISIHNHGYDEALWSKHDIIELLKALVHSRIHLQLCPSRYGQIKVTDGGGSSRYNKPVQVEVLRLGGFFTTTTFTAFMNWLLRTCRPRYIEISLLCKDLCGPLWGRGGAEAVDSLCTILLRKLEKKSLKKDLEKCSMEFRNKNAGEWCRVEGTRLTEDEWLKRPDIRFRLKWRESTWLSSFS